MGKVPTASKIGHKDAVFISLWLSVRLRFLWTDERIVTVRL